MPFVLRQTEARKIQYQLIGECYIYGIMDGEAVAAGNLTAQDSLLC
jgi:hypothetical protein